MKKLFIGLTVISAVSLFAQPVFAFTTLNTLTAPDIGAMVKNRTTSFSLNNTTGSSLSADSSLSLSQNADTSKTAPSLNAQSLGTDNSTYVQGEVLVKYKDNKINLNTVSGRTTALNFINSKALEEKGDLIKNNISVLRITDSKTVEQKVAEYRNFLGVFTLLSAVQR